MKLVGRREVAGLDHPLIRVAYSPDGSTIVGVGGTLDDSGNEVGVGFVWDAATLERRASFTSADGRIGMADFLPDGRTLFTSGYLLDGVESWDPETGRRLARIRILPDPYRKSVAGHLLTKTHVGDVAVSGNGSLVALGCWDGSAKLVRWATGKVIECFPSGANNVDFVSFARDDRRLLAGTYQDLFEWDVEDSTLVRTIPLDRSEQWTHVAFDGGDHVVSLASTGKLLVWDVASWTAEESSIAIKGPPTCLAYSPRDRLLAIGLNGKSVLFWDAAGRKPAGKHKLVGDRVHTLAFAPDRPALCVVDSKPPYLVEHEYRV